MKKKPSICWDCKNARANLCSWFYDFTPVKGWDAEWMKERVLKSGHVLKATYSIKSCPNFEPDELSELEEVLAKSKGQIQCGLANLFKEIEKISKKQTKLQNKRRTLK